MIRRNDYGRVTYVAEGSPGRATVLAEESPDPWSAMSRLLKSVRDRTPDGWWEWAGEVADAEGSGGGGWAGAISSMLDEEGPIGLLDDVIDWQEVEMECYEAQREAGFSAVAEFIRPLIPALRALP